MLKNMLEISSLCKTFNVGTINEVTSLQNVTLSIEEGSFVCVLGTNGSGKSTLLNAVAGTFLTDSGTIILKGRILPENLSLNAPARSVVSFKTHLAALLQGCQLPKTLLWQPNEARNVV